MTLKQGPETATSRTGIITKFKSTVNVKAPFYSVELGGAKEPTYLFYCIAKFSIELGKIVTLHSFGQGKAEGQKIIHGIEVHSPTGEVIMRVSSEVSMIFKD